MLHFLVITEDNIAFQVPGNLLIWTGREVWRIAERLLLWEYITLAYIIHDVCPPLHGDALKYCQHSQPKIVKVCNAIIWTYPILLTDFCSIITLITSVLATGPRLFHGKFI